MFQQMIEFNILIKFLFATFLQHKQQFAIALTPQSGGAGG